MIEELIPLFDCGCPACLRSAARNMVAIGEELEQLVDNIRPSDVRAHRTPVELPVNVRQFSAAGFRATAGSIRRLADALE